MFLVGLTGGISTGKSTVSQMLTELGCMVIDADKLAREVVEPGKPAWKKIRQHFGSEVFNDDGSLNREKMGQIVFSDETKRRLLNSITHPYIQRMMMWQIAKSAIRGYQFVVLDLPLLFETGGKLMPFFSYIIVVSCDEKSQLTRLMHRNSYSKQEALQRIKAQMPLDAKCDRATDVIDNSQGREDTRQQVAVLHKRLQTSKKQWENRIVFAACLSSAVLLSMLTYKLILQFLLNQH